MCVLKSVGTSKSLFQLNWLLAVGVVLLAGGVYRYQASRLELVVRNTISLPVPLRFLAFKVEDWVGRDVPIPEHIQRVAGNDDFINRLYVNRLNGQWANVYVAYCGRPRTMLGHRPEVCYVASGWIHENSERSYFFTLSGRQIPCLIHRFHKPSPRSEEIVVLNFYVVNGRLTCDEGVFSGVSWRTPNVDGDAARYVAQVQISSALENSVLRAARDIAEPILAFFSDGGGKVEASQYFNAGSKVLK